jgi:hypothetical protein
MDRRARVDYRFVARETEDAEPTARAAETNDRVVPEPGARRDGGRPGAAGIAERTLRALASADRRAEPVFGHARFIPFRKRPASPIMTAARPR